MTEPTDSTGRSQQPPPDDIGLSESNGRRQRPRYDKDARWAAKTRKDGGHEFFFGYEEHTLVQVPHGSEPSDHAPRLIRRAELTPAGTDVVEPTLSLIDRLNGTVRVLIADRHYSYKDTERWRDELVARGIEPILDLRKEDHGFTDLNHLMWTAGWPHCPGTPRELEMIERPAPAADGEERDSYRRKITLRQSFAFRRIGWLDPATGRAQFECPAEVPTVGCPLKPGSVQIAFEQGFPLVEHHPDSADPDFPKCCSQRTVVVRPGTLRKLMQKYYWGSHQWEREYNKRTYVEGSYGNRKNRSTENVTRGFFRTAGLPMASIALGMSVVAYNLRTLRTWQQRTSAIDPSHPLLLEHQPGLYRTFVTLPEFVGLQNVRSSQDEATHPVMQAEPSSAENIEDTAEL